MAADTNVRLQIARRVPAAQVEGEPVAPRGASLWGDGAVHALGSTRHMLADEGSYWVAQASAPGVLVNFGSASFSASSPALAFVNNEKPGGRRVSFDYIRIMYGAASGGGPGTHMAGYIDTYPRNLSSFTAFTSASMTNSDIPQPANPVGCFYGSPAGLGPNPAGGTFRGSLFRLSPQVFAPNLAEQVVRFGTSRDGCSSTPHATTGRFVSNAPPIVIAPQAAFYIMFFGIAAQAEAEVGYWIR